MISLLLILLASKPDLQAVLRLMGRFDGGHACPIGSRLALTNAHVVDVRPFDKEFPAYPAVYSTPWQSGYVVPTKDGLESARDLARVEPQTDYFQAWYTVSDDPPLVGDKVYFLGYD